MTKVHCLDRPGDSMQISKVPEDDSRMLVTANEGEDSASVYVNRARARVLAVTLMAFAENRLLPPDEDDV